MCQLLGPAKGDSGQTLFLHSSGSLRSSSLLQCLCLSPTYELALQTGKVIEQMGRFYPALKLAYAVRGNKRESPAWFSPFPGSWQGQSPAG